MPTQTHPIADTSKSDTSTLRYDVLIVGAGHGGGQCALNLRREGFEGSIGVVGEEPDAPYERPPLSKDYLAGEKGFDRLLLRPIEAWAEQGIDLLLGRRVEAVDATAKTVALASGESLAWGELVWAAGGRARRLALAGDALPDQHVVRTRADIDALVEGLGGATTVLIVGGGYIGLEAAAVLRKMGKAVHIAELGSRVLARVAGLAISDYFARLHRDNGVHIHFGVSVDRVERGADGALQVVELSDGERIAADALVVGIGILPNVEPLVDAGADAALGGVVVDAQGRTSLPGVWALGDCVAYANPQAQGRTVRLESVQNALDQAGVVAKTLAGKDAAYDALPWFWSHQYGARLQTAGLSTGHDREVLRGDPASGAFSVAYLQEGRLLAVDAVNSPRDYVAARKLIPTGLHPDPERLADPDVPLTAFAGG